MRRSVALALIVLTGCVHGHVSHGADALVDAILIATVIAIDASAVEPPRPQVMCDDGTTVEPPHTCPATISSPPPPPPDER